MFRKPSKKEKEWAYARKKLKKIYEVKEITTCELRFNDCLYNNFLGFAHRKKRREYYGNPELLGSFEETLLACVSCHQKIENNKELTDEVFKRLRPE